VYAMKAIKKDALSPRTVRCVIQERSIQAQLRSRTIVNIHFAF